MGNSFDLLAYTLGYLAGFSAALIILYLSGKKMWDVYSRSFVAWNVILYIVTVLYVIYAVW